jgi:hypothetical protein
LAAAYSVNGEFDRAVGLQEKIVEKAPAMQKPFAEAILKLYVDKQPFDAKVAKQLQTEMASSASLPTPNEAATEKSPPKTEPLKPAKKRAL